MTAAPGPATAPGLRDVRVIWNAGAGRKAGVATNEDVTAEQLEACFAPHGLRPRIIATDSAAAAVDATRTAREEGADVVVAAGGDGTLHVVARELLTLAEDEANGRRPAPVLGILPLGSVMNVARSLAIPRDLDQAAAIIAAGHARNIDVGLVNGEPFLEGAAVGLHAALFREGDRFDRGDYAAVLRGLWTALRYRGSRMLIRLDDRNVRTRALVVSVANGPYAGLGFTVAPGALLDDGMLDVRVFEQLSRFELLTHFWSILLGKRTYEPRVETYRSRTVEITSRSLLPARADGESLGGTPIRCSVLPGALRVLTLER